AQAAGLRVEPAQLGFDPEGMWETWLTWRHFLLAGALGVHYDDPATRALLKPEAIWEIEQGRGLTAAALYQASLSRSDLYRAVLDLFGRFDFLVLPTSQVFPFAVDTPWPRSIAGRAMDTYHRW